MPHNPYWLQKTMSSSRPDNTFLTHVGLGSQQLVGSSGNPALGGDRLQTIRQTVRQLYGPNVAVETNRMVDIDLYQSNPMSAKGLAVHLQGAAEVVSVNVAENLAQHQDPIKVLLGTRIVDAPRVIIKRRCVRGAGAAEPIPERAPGRLVSVQEQEREIVLQRHGCDIEQNTNLFLDPVAAQQDLSMKLNFQQAALNQRLVDLGYEEARRAATDLVESALRNDPARAHLEGIPRAIEKSRIFSRDVFAALDKYPRGLSNLLCLAKRAMPASADPYDTAICPAGIQYGTFQKAENTRFALSGLKSTENADGQPFTFEYKDAYRDPSSGFVALLHTPSRNYEGSGGTLASSANAEGGLQEQVMWWQMHDVFDDQGNVNYIVDYEKQAWVKIPIGEPERVKFKVDEFNGTVDPQTNNVSGYGKRKSRHYVYVRVICGTTSGILVGKAGAETGELLTAFPSEHLTFSPPLFPAFADSLRTDTAVSTTATSPETMRMQLRAYLGSAIYKNENVGWLPHTHFHGLTNGYSVPTNLDNEPTAEAIKDLFEFTTPKAVGSGFFLKRDESQTYGIFGSGVDTFQQSFTRLVNRVGGLEQIGLTASNDDLETMSGRKVPVVGYLGATAKKTATGYEVIQHNLGHLGRLDDPVRCANLHGAAHFVDEPLLIQSA